MSYMINDFVGQLHLITGDFPTSTTRAAELNAIAAALATDPTQHDRTMEEPPAGLRFAAVVNTPYTNQVLRLVNRGRGGNLTPLAMGNAITAELSKLFPPVQTSAPVVSGTGTVGQTLSVTNGNWTYAPTSYAYQWRRGATNIAGATAATYLLVAADSGTTVTCQVTATNAAGSTPASLSNGIAVA